MKFLIISAISSIFLYTSEHWSGSKVGGQQLPRITIVYHPVSTAKLDHNTDTLVETWKTNNTVTFQSDPRKMLFSFKETNGKKQVVRSYSYPVVRFREDSDTYLFTLNTGEGTANYVVWKDKRMVVIEAADYNYIISK